MNEYLNKTDLTRGIRAEVLDTLTRGDDQVCLHAISEACSEVAGYLSARYDITEELKKTASDERVALVVKIVREVALFNIYNFSSPVNMPETRQKAYDNTIAFLRNVQSEKASIVGLSRLNTDPSGNVQSSYIAYGGNEKRQNHF